MTASEHAALHGRALAARGIHVFQRERFRQPGATNPMHRSAAFWKDEEKAGRYRQRQRERLDHERARRMQHTAGSVRMINVALRLINNGGSIDSLEEYLESRKRLIGRIGDARKIKRAIARRFGSFDSFRAAVAASNHRVVSVEPAGESEVYDVEVDCPTRDDHSPESGHNFVIWDSDEPTGTGIVVSNTRRAAKMVVLDVDHPDVLDFIRCKVREERKAWALIDAGYDGSFTGTAYSSVFFQNSNNSVRVPDEFMRAVADDGEWQTRRVTGEREIAETHRARDIMREIAEAAHVCGDPGMQFDTTINEWHTCPKTDRIYASNPCARHLTSRGRLREIAEATAAVTRPRARRSAA